MVTLLFFFSFSWLFSVLISNCIQRLYHCRLEHIHGHFCESLFQFVSFLKKKMIIFFSRSGLFNDYSRWIWKIVPYFLPLCPRTLSYDLKILLSANVMSPVHCM